MSDEFYYCDDDDYDDDDGGGYQNQNSQQQNDDYDDGDYEEYDEQHGGEEQQTTNDSDQQQQQKQQGVQENEQEEHDNTNDQSNNNNNNNNSKSNNSGNNNSNKLICPQCGCVDIETIDSAGNSVCMSCGLVVEENAIVSSVEFAEGLGGAASMVGKFVASSSTKAFTGGGVGGPGGGGPGGYGFSRDSREATIANGRRRIQDVASRLRLGNTYIDAAHRLFIIAVEKNFIKGRRTLHVVATCLYIACRQEKTQHMLIDFSDILQVYVYTLGTTFLKFRRLLGIKVEIIDPALYVYRFAAHLDLGDDVNAVSVTALRLVARMKRDWIQTGRRPAGVCAAALLLSSRMHGYNKHHSDVTRILKVCGWTVHRRLKEFELTPSSSLSMQQFHTIDIESECDPPIYRYNKIREARAEAILNNDTNLLISGALDDVLYDGSGKKAIKWRTKKNNNDVNTTAALIAENNSVIASNTNNNNNNAVATIEQQHQQQPDHNVNDNAALEDQTAIVTEGGGNNINSNNNDDDNVAMEEEKFEELYQSIEREMMMETTTTTTNDDNEANNTMDTTTTDGDDDLKDSNQYHHHEEDKNDRSEVLMTGHNDNDNDAKPTAETSLLKTVTDQGDNDDNAVLTATQPEKEADKEGRPSSESVSDWKMGDDGKLSTAEASAAKAASAAEAMIVVPPTPKRVSFANETETDKQEVTDEETKKSKGKTASASAATTASKSSMKTPKSAQKKTIKSSIRTKKASSSTEVTNTASESAVVPRTAAVVKPAPPAEAILPSSTKTEDGSTDILAVVPNRWKDAYPRNHRGRAIILPYQATEEEQMAPTAPVQATLTLSDFKVDMPDSIDKEIDAMFRTEEEERQKEAIFVKMNKDFIFQQERKEKERANAEALSKDLELQDAEQAQGHARYRRRRNKNGIDSTGGGTTEEALMATISSRKISRKINYDALSSIFDDDGTFSTNTAVVETTTTETNNGGSGGGGATTTSADNGFLQNEGELMAAAFHGDNDVAMI